MIRKKVVDISKVVGKGYGQFWKDKEHRYIVCKGGRGSKKSKTASLWLIYHIMKYPESNALCIRQVFNTLRDSVWSDLQWACERLGVSHLWEFTKSPLEATYRPTGQKILFRGCDNPLSLTSISVSKGVLNFCLIEEAYQITEDSFNKIDMSLRGILSEGYFFRIMLIFNPWSSTSWLKKRFFDNPCNNTLAMTTTWRCNEWIGEQAKILFEEMKVRNPRRYAIESEGEWGRLEGTVFTNYKMEDFDLSKMDNKDNLILCNGCDFGFNDPTVFLRSAVDMDNKIIYIYEEHYHQFMTVDDMENLLKKHNLNRVEFIADNARPEIIEQLNRKGCKLKACKKGKDSIMTGIAFLQDFEIIIHPSCPKTYEEFTLYSFAKDKEGNLLDKPEDANNHALDSLRYSTEPLMKPKKKSRIRSW